MEIITPTSAIVATTRENIKLLQSKKVNTSLLIRFLKGYVKVLQKLSGKQAADFAFNRFASPFKYRTDGFEKTWINQAKVFESNHQNQKIKFYSWGAYGPIVLLVHGWNSSAAAMTHYVDPLLSQGYRVLALDAPAHGDSAGKQTNMLEYAKAISHVINYTGKNVEHVIAHSFGGSSTIFMMNHFENKFKIKKLVLISTLTNLKYSTEMYAKAIGLDEITERFLFNKIEQIFQSQNLNNIDISNIAKGFTHDICVIHDKKDKVVPLVDVYNYSHTSRKIITEGVGHTRILKDPEVIRQAITFINE